MEKFSAFYNSLESLDPGKDKRMRNGFTYVETLYMFVTREWVKKSLSPSNLSQASHWREINWEKRKSSVEWNSSDTLRDNGVWHLEKSLKRVEGVRRRIFKVSEGGAKEWWRRGLNCSFCSKVANIPDVTRSINRKGGNVPTEEKPRHHNRSCGKNKPHEGKYNKSPCLSHIHPHPKPRLVDSKEKECL